MLAMDRRGTAWGVALALAAVGGLVAHLVAYALAMPGASQSAGPHGTAGHVHGAIQAAAPHAYWQHLRVCLAICLAVALIGLVVATLERAGGRRHAFVPLWLFAAVPPLGFVAQDQLERVLHTGAMSHASALGPRFFLGLALQIPFALLAFFAARGLLEVAAALVRHLGTLDRPRVTPLELWLRPVQLAPAIRRSPLARGFGQRAPPR